MSSKVYLQGNRQIMLVDALQWWPARETPGTLITINDTKSGMDKIQAAVRKSIL